MKTVLLLVGFVALSRRNMRPKTRRYLVRAIAPESSVSDSGTSVASHHFSLSESICEAPWTAAGSTSVVIFFGELAEAKDQKPEKKEDHDADPNAERNQRVVEIGSREGATEREVCRRAEDVSYARENAETPCERCRAR
jgi:hypothetical protein